MSEYPEYKYLEFSHTVKRTIPPTMITLEEIEKYREKYGNEDIYTSVYRYIDKDPNKGPVLSGFYMDFDSPDDIGTARKEACKVIEGLVKDYKIPEEFISITFTGHKGFAIFVNRRVFNVEPSQHLPLIWKSIALFFREKYDLKTIDLKVYERRRLWRLFNTRHPESGLFKIPITYSELKTLTVDEIKKMAVKPRLGITIPKPSLIEEARQLYLAHVEKVKKWLIERREVLTGSDLISLDNPVPCVVRRMEEGADQGIRNSACFALAVYLTASGKQKSEVKNIILKFNRERCKPPLNEREVFRTIESAWKGTKEGRYSVGCGTEVFSDLCDTSVCPFFTPGIKLQPLTEDIRAFLLNPQLYEKTIEILDYIIVGESNLKTLIFFSSIGASIHEKPSGIIIVERLGAGKSFISREILTNLLPRERVDQPTSVTEEAVNYLAENFKGRIVRIDEIYGMEKGIPRIRSWMTEGRLEHWVAPTGEDEERKTRKIISEGCPVFITSTTGTPEAQFARRNWIVFCDTSKEQTERIHKYQHEREKYPKIYFKDQQTSLDLLRRAAKYVMENTKPVLIPFDFSFPAHDVRSRGDRDRFVQLIKNIANWHMLQRDRLIDKEGNEYLIASEEDFKIALKIAKPFLRPTLMGLDKVSLQLLDLIIEKLKKEGRSFFTIKDIELKKEDGSRYSEKWLWKKLEVLEENNYVSISRDTKPYEISLIECSLEEEPIKIIDDGKGVLKVYKELGIITSVDSIGSPRNFGTSQAKPRSEGLKTTLKQNMVSTGTNLGKNLAKDDLIFLSLQKVPHLTSEPKEVEDKAELCSKCGGSLENFQFKQKDGSILCYNCFNEWKRSKDAGKE